MVSHHVDVQPSPGMDFLLSLHGGRFSTATNPDSGIYQGMILVTVCTVIRAYKKPSCCWYAY